MSHSAALLLLTDGRLPAGGYAHSGGFEPAAQLQGLTDAAELERFLEGRAATAGFVAAAFAAAACDAAHARNVPLLSELDSEFDARIPSPALRAVSRSLGRQLARALTAIRGATVIGELGATPHQPVVAGAAAAEFELEPHDAALMVLHDSVAGPAAAAVKVLSLDPFAAHAALAHLTGFLDELARDAAAHARVAPEDLPALAAPLLDIAAEHHRSWDARLFAS